MEYKVYAYCTTSRLDIKKLTQASFGKIRRREGSFLLIELDTNRFLYLKDYGGVAFFNCNQETIRQFKSAIHLIAEADFTDIEEKITVLVSLNPPEDELFDTLLVPKLSIDIVSIVCLNLCQSSALFYYQGTADGVLERTRQYTNELEQKGNVSLSRKKLMRYIGSTLNIKNKISENLYIFETPQLAWEDYSINFIDKKLNDELEIRYRYNAIKEQVEVIQDNLDLFKDLSLHKHSSFLEWIIILLILFEILQVLIEKIFF